MAVLGAGIEMRRSPESPLHGHISPVAAFVRTTVTTLSLSSSWRAVVGEGTPALTHPSPLPLRERIPPTLNFVLLTPELRKKTAFRDLDHDHDLDLDRFPSFSVPAFMGRERVRPRGEDWGRVRWSWGLVANNPPAVKSRQPSKQRKTFLARSLLRWSRKAARARAAITARASFGRRFRHLCLRLGGFVLDGLEDAVGQKSRAAEHRQGQGVCLGQDAGGAHDGR